MARICEWCLGPIDPSARADAVYCGKRCRQANWRFTGGCPRREATDEPRRWKYADPPYPGLAHLYEDHPDFDGEVDHKRLVEQLRDGCDGWALSTSSDALREVWDLCPEARLAPWFRGARGGRTWQPGKAYEAVLYVNPRPILSTTRVDALVHTARPRTSDPRRVLGAKPARFAYWLFELLGARPGDEFIDMFPGSGGMARAWRIYESRLQGPDASTRTSSDASRLPGPRRVAFGRARDASSSTRDDG